MAHRLVVDISEDVYESLVETAKKVGQDPQTLAAEWLANATQRVHDDPLERFIGAFNSRVAGWADNHDKYIGEGIMKTVRVGGMVVPSCVHRGYCGIDGESLHTI